MCVPKIIVRGNMADNGDGSRKVEGAFMTCMDFVLKGKGKPCRAFD